MSRTALVIDNDENTVSQVSAALSPLGYSVSSASDAAAGLEMANNLVPSIMLVNLATPGSNGLELCKSIHGTDALKDVPIILLTLREGKFDPVYVKLYGIVSFLKKPFNDDSLLSLVSEHSIAVEGPAEEAFAEPVMETFEETSYDAEPVEESYSITEDADAFEDSDATVAMTVDAVQEDEYIPETAYEDEGFSETVTLTDEESDLENLQASFSTDEYADDETVAIDESAQASDESFDFSSAQMSETSVDEHEETGSGWGDMSASMTMDASDDSASTAHADETWGGMGGNMMTDAFGESAAEEESPQADVFSATGLEDAGGFNAGGFDSEGTMAFDSGSESAFSAGGDEAGGFDSEGTVSFGTGMDEAFDAGDSGDLDIGGFQASKDAASSATSGFDMEDGTGDSAWGDGSIESKPAPEEQPAAMFDETEDAFSSGFEEEGEEGLEASADEGFAVDEDLSFDDGDAGFEDAFLEDTGESDVDFSGDDQDYTGLFDTTEEETPDDGIKGKKKKKKRFKKGPPSKLRRVLMPVLLVLILAGGAFYFRDMIPFEMPDIDIKIPFIGKEAPKAPSTAAKRPVAKTPQKAEPATPAPVPEEIKKAKTEAKVPKPVTPATPKPEPVAPKETVRKAPEKPVETMRAKKEPQAPKQETPKAPVKEASKPVPSKTSTGKFQKGFYYVQFGVFGNARNAEILSKQLNKKGLPTLKRVITNSKGKKLTVVLLDRPYKTLGSAENRAKSISDSTGFDTAVYK